MLYFIKISTFEPLNFLTLFKKIKKINFFFYKKKKLITVIKSPFIFKKTRNQFFLTTYKVNLKMNLTFFSPKLFEFFLLSQFKKSLPILKQLDLVKIKKSNKF
jgi:hypothetical protein